MAPESGPVVPAAGRSQAAEEWDAMMNAARQAGGRSAEMPAAPPGGVQPQGTLAVVRTEDTPPAGAGGVGGMAMAGSAEPQENNSDGQPAAETPFFAMAAGDSGWAPTPAPVPDTNDPNDPNHPNAPERRP